MHYERGGGKVGEREKGDEREKQQVFSSCTIDGHFNSNHHTRCQGSMTDQSGTKHKDAHTYTLRLRVTAVRLTLFSAGSSVLDMTCARHA